MTKILNCASIETAKESIAEIFEISTLQLEEFFISLGDSNQPHIQEDYVYEMFSDKFGYRTDFEVMYFHGTRIANIDSFKTQGILPLDQVVHQIENDLTQLAKDHQIGLSKPFEFVPDPNRRNYDEPGPLGFLVRDALLSEHDYLRIPEVINDLIKSSISPEQEKSFIEIFKAKYKPYIMWFVAPKTYTCVSYALWYIFLDWHKDLDKYSCLGFSTFDGFGRPIPPEKIYKIEKIDLRDFVFDSPKNCIDYSKFSLTFDRKS